MSNYINTPLPDDLKRWQAPRLNVDEEKNFDYKINSAESLIHKEQQQKIRQQAYEKSFAKGYLEGVEKGQSEINEQVSHLHTLMATLAMPINGVDDQVVNELALLSMNVAKQLIKRELSISPDIVVNVVKETLNLLPVSATEICIELHPEDARLVREAILPMESDLIKSNMGHRIIENIDLTRGGCRVSTNSSRIDASVEHHVKTAIAVVMGSETINE